LKVHLRYRGGQAILQSNFIEEVQIFHASMPDEAEGSVPLKRKKLKFD